MRRWAWMVGLACTLVLGCSHDSNRVMAPPAATPPARSTPEEVARLFEWTYENRDTAEYATLFTDDFHFEFDPSDSSGNAYRTEPWGRAEEVQSGGHLFVGGSATEPPASSIDVTINSLTIGDTQDTLDPTTHRRVHASIVLNIRAGGALMEVQGNAELDVVRANVANISSALRARLHSTDWLIYRWIDGTLPGGGEPVASPNPARSTTWGMIKVLYL